MKRLPKVEGETVTIEREARDSITFRATSRSDLWEVSRGGGSATHLLVQEADGSNNFDLQSAPDATQLSGYDMTFEDVIDMF